MVMAEMDGHDNSLCLTCSGNLDKEVGLNVRMGLPFKQQIKENVCRTVNCRQKSSSRLTICGEDDFQKGKFLTHPSFLSGKADDPSKEVLFEYK